MSPTENVPKLATRMTPSTPRRPLVRKQTVVASDDEAGEDDGVEPLLTRDVGVNTERDVFEDLKTKVCDEIKVMTESAGYKFSLKSIANDDVKVLFYTGFPSYQHLKICFDFLGPATEQLMYRDSRRVFDHSNKGRPRSLPPMEELFLTLVRLRLGLLEQDIAYRFGVSQSTVSRIFTTWINFLFLEFKQIPLWPPKESHMPKIFQQKYPCTQVIIDATEVYIQQSSLPELQQRTFSNYKNHNTFKADQYLSMWHCDLCVQALSWEHCQQGAHTSKWTFGQASAWRLDHGRQRLRHHG